jgi:hypothetical protein
LEVTGRVGGVWKNHGAPQRLKPGLFLAAYGTTKVVPFPSRVKVKLRAELTAVSESARIPFGFAQGRLSIARDGSLALAVPLRSG